MSYAACHGRFVRVSCVERITDGSTPYLALPVQFLLQGWVWGGVGGPVSATGGTGANTYSTFNDHASVCVLTCEYVRRRCVSRRESPTSI